MRWKREKKRNYIGLQRTIKLGQNATTTRQSLSLTTSRLVRSSGKPVAFFNFNTQTLVSPVCTATGSFTGLLLVSTNCFRLTWAEERKRNLETFGVPGRFLRGQGFRGGYTRRRGRGTAPTLSSYRTTSGKL